MDIEKIADSVKEKKSINKYEGELQRFTSPISKEVFLSRDIKDFHKRQAYLLELINKETSYKTNTVYEKPKIKNIFINGKRANINIPDKIKREPNEILIKDCKNELMQIEDLIRFEKIAKEYITIKGKNEKKHYLFYAKEGQTNNEYVSPKYYTKKEFEDIVAMMAAEIDKEILNEEEMSKENLNNANPLLKWNAPVNSLYTLFYDFLDKNVITWNGKTNEGAKKEIERLLTIYFVDKDNNKLSAETIKQALKPNTQKAKKRIDITPILPKKKSIKKT